MGLFLYSYIKSNMKTLAAIFLVLFALSDVTYAEQAKQTKVGLVLPLTGKAADYGFAIRNCIDLARKDRPELFENIIFKYEDAAFEPRLAVSALNKLIDVEKIDLSVTWGVSFCKALAPIAEFRKMPLVGICIDPEAAANRQHVMRFMNTTDDFMKVNVDYLLKNNHKKIALLLTDHPYLEEMYEALKRNIKPGQTLTVVDRLPQTEMDFRSQIVKLQKSDFDTIGIFLFVGQISTFYKQARHLGFSKPTFGTNLFESFSEVATSQGSMDGAVFASMKINPEFISRYKAIYGNDSQLAFGAPAYEFALALGELLKLSGSSKGAEELIKRFAGVSGKGGSAAGPYNYQHDASAGKYMRFPLVMKKIKDQSFSDLIE